MDEKEHYLQKQKFFEKKMKWIKRQHSGFIKSKIDVVLSPEEADAEGIEHDV